MNYLLKDNKLYKFDENIIIEKPYYANDIEVCIDESGFALFDKLNKDNAKVEDNLLKVGKTKIKTFEYNLPNFNYDFNLDCEFQIDLNIIKEASKFTDSKGLKPVLSGVYVNNLGTITATDSFKLYHYHKGKSEKGVILTKELVNEIIKYAGCKGAITFNKNNAQVIINNNDEIVKITGRLVNAEYPNVENLVKRDYTNLIQLNKEELKNIVEIGKLVNGTDITVYINNNEITFTGDNEYNTEFDTKNLDIFMRLDNLTNVLSVLNKDEILLSHLGDKKPIMFYEDEKTILVLPIRKL